MKILLVNPFGSNWIEGRRDDTETAVRLAPMGILFVASYLMKKGFDVDIYNCRGRADKRTADLIGKVISLKPDIIGFTSTTSSFPGAYHLVTEIKNVLPEVKIVFGGVHVSALREKILEGFPLIDYLVTGEGEIAMTELAEGKDPATIQGVLSRDAQGIQACGFRTELCELDSLPLPAYNKLEGFPKYFEPPLFNYPKAPSASMISSRGCPYQCSYCDRSVFRRSFRFNSAEYLYEHMSLLKKDFNVKHIFFYDDLFTFNRERVEKFCGLLREKPLKMTFNCAVRVGHADDALLRTLKAAGGWMVSIGMESGDQELLDRHKAKVTLEQIRDTVRRIQKNGMRVKGLFMMGLPGETEQTVKKTTDFIEELRLDDMNMTKFTPFPGAPAYRTIHEEGTFDEKWELMNCMNFVFVPKGIGSKEKMEELHRQAIKRFYTGKNWMKKFWPLMFKCPDSTFRLIKHLPTFLRIRNQFE
jgi:anaerobic magnesium-protoporphyrin IX monomethyl ester cyclase